MNETPSPHFTYQDKNGFPRFNYPYLAGRLRAQLEMVVLYNGHADQVANAEALLREVQDAFDAHEASLKTMA